MAFQHTPFQDTLLADLAVSLLQDPEVALGRRGVADILFLSFSAHDYVAHAYGAESEEALEVVRHLDVTLGKLLDALDAALPKEQLVVVLTSDHGFAPLPEAASPPGARLDPKSFRKALNASLATRSCLDPSAAPIGAMAGWGIYYDHTVLPQRTRHPPTIAPKIGCHGLVQEGKTAQAAGGAPAVARPRRPVGEVRQLQGNHYKKEVLRNANVCHKCGYHFRISSKERLASLFDNGIYEEVDRNIVPTDPLGFKDTKPYKDRLRAYQEETGMKDAVINAVGLMGGMPVVISAMEYGFMGGSMGSVVGEKVARAAERALADRCPLLVCVLTLPSNPLPYTLPSVNRLSKPDLAHHKQSFLLRTTIHERKGCMP